MVYRSVTNAYHSVTVSHVMIDFYDFRMDLLGYLKDADVKLGWTGGINKVSATILKYDVLLHCETISGNHWLIARYCFALMISYVVYRSVMYGC